MNAAQCRMARAGLQWTVDRLAAEAEVSRRTVMRHEGGQVVQPASLEAMRSALARGGAAFTNGGGRVGVTVPRAD